MRGKEKDCACVVFANLHLIEEHARMVVAYDTVRRDVGITEIEDEKASVVMQRHEARDHVTVVSVLGGRAECRSRHGNDPVRDVGQV